MYMPNVMKPTSFLFVIVSIFFISSTINVVVGYPVGGDHEPNGFSTTCAYFHWFMCDTPTKRANPVSHFRPSCNFNRSGCSCRFFPILMIIFPIFPRFLYYTIFFIYLNKLQLSLVCIRS